MSEYNRNSEWEKDDSVVQAYTVGRAVYYIVANEEQNTYLLQYWPDKHKDIETVSMLDSFETKENAIDSLQQKVESITSEK